MATYHLCFVLGRLLCRVTHLGLCIGLLCPTLFDVVMGLTTPKSTIEQPMLDGQTLPSPYSKLKTVTIGTTLTQAFSLCPSAVKLPHSSEEPLTTAKRTFLERAQACIAANKFPPLERFTFSNRAPVDPDSFNSIGERDLIRTTTKCNPFVIKGVVDSCN
jgi:hypothetical protein